MFIISFFLFPCFLKFTFFYKYCKYVIYQLYLIVLQLPLGCKKKLVVFRWTNSNLDGAVCLRIFDVKFKLSSIDSNHTTVVPGLTANSDCFSNSNCFSSCFAVFSPCILWYSRSVTSSMFIDNKAVLFFLIMPILCLLFHLEAVCKVTEWQTVM